MMQAKHSLWLAPKMVPSYKEICAHISKVVTNAKWLIKDGGSVSLLREPWLADLPLACWPTFVSVEVGDMMQVFDLIQPSREGRDTMLVTHMLGDQLVKWVLTQAIPTKSNQDVRV